MKTKLLHWVLKFAPIRRFVLRVIAFIDNISYKAITKVAIVENGGVHPKHDIINYHQFFLNNLKETDTVIDIGCGRGENTADIAKKVRAVVGIDTEAVNINIAQEMSYGENIRYILGDATTYTFDTSFNAIVLSNVLEHIEHRIDFLKRLRPVSDIILLRVPMITRDWVAVYKAEHGLNYLLDPTHFTEFTLAQLREEVSAGGWQIDSYSVQFGEFWGILRST